MPRGNCYATSEAAYHILGGKKAGWKPMTVRHQGETHWYLQHESGIRLDLTHRQYKTKPDYSKAVGRGFLTKEPSRAARAMIDSMTFKKAISAQTNPAAVAQLKEARANNMGKLKPIKTVVRIRKGLPAVAALCKCGHTQSKHVLWNGDASGKTGACHGCFALDWEHRKHRNITSYHHYISDTTADPAPESNATTTVVRVGRSARMTRLRPALERLANDRGATPGEAAAARRMMRKSPKIQKSDRPARNFDLPGPPSSGFWQDNPAKRCEQGESHGHPNYCGHNWLKENPNTSTAGYRNVEADPNEIAKIPGARGEEKRIDQNRVDGIAEHLKQHGFSKIGGPYIEVDHTGKPTISEGNHRTRAAVKLGMKTMPVEVRYFGGSEELPGVWKPNGMKKSGIEDYGGIPHRHDIEGYQLRDNQIMRHLHKFHGWDEDDFSRMADSRPTESPNEFAETLRHYHEHNEHGGSPPKPGIVVRVDDKLPGDIRDMKLSISHTAEDVLEKAFGPDANLQSVAQAYSRKPINVASVKHSPGIATKIAQAYGRAPLVGRAGARHSYRQFGREVHAQFAHLQTHGYKMEPWTKPGQPYQNSAEMHADVRQNKHLHYFTGGEKHPLLSADTNNKFRAIHDVFGHAMGGHSFGPNGEESAWKEHAQMFSPTARHAMTTETRGQNSFVNYGPHGEANRANPEQTTYAPQKAVLLPKRFSKSKGLWLRLTFPGFEGRPISLKRTRRGLAFRKSAMKFKQQCQSEGYDAIDEEERAAGRTPQPWSCTRPLGHKGDHVARAFDRNIRFQWPNVPDRLPENFGKSIGDWGERKYSVQERHQIEALPHNPAHVNGITDYYKQHVTPSDWKAGEAWHRGAHQTIEERTGGEPIHHEGIQIGRAATRQHVAESLGAMSPRVGWGIGAFMADRVHHREMVGNPDNKGIGLGQSVRRARIALRGGGLGSGKSGKKTRALANAAQIPHGPHTDHTQCDQELPIDVHADRVIHYKRMVDHGPTALRSNTHQQHSNAFRVAAARLGKEPHALHFASWMSMRRRLHAKQNRGVRAAMGAEDSAGQPNVLRHTKLWPGSKGDPKLLMNSKAVWRSLPREGSREMLLPDKAVTIVSVNA